MTGPNMTFEFLPVQSAIALLATFIVAYVLAHHLGKREAVLLAGLAVPAAVIGIGLYHVATAPEVPRGMIVLVTLCVAAAASPFTLMTSRVAVGLVRG
jgi:ABC-type spermidine/putrescine transport system permease subunit II